MVKQLITILLLSATCACHKQESSTQLLQNQIDSLKRTVANSYKPGFGEFMSSIQVHHSKLWFAGQSENWKLADFEIHEIKESLESIQKYQTERSESQKIEMLNPAIDSMEFSIQQKNPELFKRSYISLTNTCNNCHRAVKFEFNVVKIPETPPFTNQDFRIHVEK